MLAAQAPEAHQEFKISGEIKGTHFIQVSHPREGFFLSVFFKLSTELRGSCEIKIRSSQGALIWLLLGAESKPQ